MFPGDFPSDSEIASSNSRQDKEAESRAHSTWLAHTTCLSLYEQMGSLFAESVEAESIELRFDQLTTSALKPKAGLSGPPVLFRGSNISTRHERRDHLALLRRRETGRYRATDRSNIRSLSNQSFSTLHTHPWLVRAQGHRYPRLSTSPGNHGTPYVL